MPWYKRITRRWISRTDASIGFVADIANNVHASTRNPNSGFSMASLLHSIEEILFSMKEHDHITVEQLRPTPPVDDIPGSPKQSDEQRTRCRRGIGLASTRSRLQHSEASDYLGVPRT